MGTHLHPPQKGAGEPPPQFSAYVHCGQSAGWIKTALGTEMGLCPGHIVLDGAAPLPKIEGGSPSPIFGPLQVYCGQMVGCIKMSLDRELGLSPGDFVLDGDPALLP